MADDFEYISRARLDYRGGYRNAYLGEVPEPVVYGVQGALREYYGAMEGPPIASTLDHIVPPSPAECTAPFAAPWQGARSRLTGTLRGYRGRPHRRLGKTIRIKSIHVHYELAVPPSRGGHRAGADVHPPGMPGAPEREGAIDSRGMPASGRRRHRRGAGRGRRRRARVTAFDLWNEHHANATDGHLHRRPHRRLAGRLTHVAADADRIAHVVERVEERHEVVVRVTSGRASKSR